MLVIAGPGSGKTSTLCQRVFHLVNEFDISENKILVLTFTKKAAAHMKERYEDLTGRPSECNFSTIHSLCYRILCDYSGKKSLDIINDIDKAKLIKRLVFDEIGYSDMDEDTVDMLQELTYKHKLSTEMGVKFNEDIIRSGVFGSELSFKVFYDRMEEYKKKNGIMDFDDLLYETRRAFTDNRKFLNKWQSTFRYCLVDEFQDTNEIQFEIIKMLSAKHLNVFAVGDDDQSIYAFRGAVPFIMNKFIEEYPDCDKVFLEINYRSIRKITDFSNKLIVYNKDRMPKVMKTLNDFEGRISVKAYADQISQYRKILSEITVYGNKDDIYDTAVLFRTNMQKERFLHELMLYPVLCGNTKNHEIYNRIAAFYRVLSGKFDMNDIYESMNLFGGAISRYYAPKRKEDLSCWVNICKSCNAKDEEVAVTEYLEMIEFCEKLTPEIALLTIARNKGFLKSIKSRFEENCDFERFINEFKCSINKMIEGCRTFEEAALNIDKSPERGKEEGAVAVNVMTLHECKGLEFTNVYIPDLNYGLMPIARAVGEDEIEEERRLLYVGITRAKRNLMLSYSKTINGRETPASGFINELISGYSSSSSRES